MPTVKIAGKDHEVLPPRRRIYFTEVGSKLDDPALWLRARAAIIGLACPSVWATRKGPTPRYTGDVAAYGEEVFEHLAEMGEQDPSAVGVAVWVAWVDLVKGATNDEVQEATGFTGAGGAQKTGSTGASS